jgi:hypothetical protein
MNHCDEVSIRRFREPDLCQLVRLVSETIGLSYAEVYSPRAVQFFKDYHSEKNIADRSKTGTTLVVEEDGDPTAATLDRRKRPSGFGCSESQTPAKSDLNHRTKQDGSGMRYSKTLPRRKRV